MWLMKVQRMLLKGKEKMRDEKRIKPFLEELQNIWERVPDWRFFQLICNIQRGLGSDGFYLEDDDALVRIKNMFYQKEE